MSYKLDGLQYADAGTGSALGTLTNPVYMEYDGRYMWVTFAGPANAGIGIFEFWGEFSGNEPAWENIDELSNPQTANSKVRLVSALTVTASHANTTTLLKSIASVGRGPGAVAVGAGPVYTRGPARIANQTALATPYWIKKCAGKMYVANSANFTKLYEFDIQTQLLIREISIAASTLSNLCVSNGKLWYVGSAFSDTTVQKLYCFDPVANTTTFTDIPARPSTTRAWLASGNNGSVYVTNYNNVSVSKFSDVDGAFQSTIGVNAQPTHIFSGPDRRIWVSSFGGMISLIDHDDDGVHNDYSSGPGDANRAISLASDPTDGSKIWFVTSGYMLARQDLNTHEQLELSSPVATEDWEFKGDTLGNNIETLYITQQMYFQDSTLTTHLLKPYIFFTEPATSRLFALRLDRYLAREVYATVNGQAAVAMGPQEYFGE